MKRWRVRASRRTPWWHYMDSTYFVDADTAEQAAQGVESTGSDVESVHPFEVIEATEAMEMAHADRMARRSEWLARVKRGENPRGLL